MAAELMDKKHAELVEAIKDATTPHELELAYKAFIDTALQAFRPRAHRTREAPPPYWTDALTTATRLRSKLYKRWKGTNCPKAKSAYQKHDKETKRLIRKAKRASFKELGTMLEQSPHPEALLARYSKNRETRKSKNNTTVSSTVDPTAFTQYIATKFPVTDKMPKTEPREFTVSEDFRKEIAQALLLAPKGKAAGADGIFVEVLQLTPLRSALFIQELWIQCGRMKYTPEDWRITIWVPIYKNGPQGVPCNYRPIALLSQIRKIVEVAINRAILKVIIFHPTQCGFKTRSGCEQAILRYMSNIKRARLVAILDLKGAYGSIPRHRLIDLIDQRIPPNLAAMATAFLTEETCYTIGNPENTVSIRRGVPEGSPLSPTLFNLVMDTLSAQIQQENPDPTIIPNIMFADDVNLMAIQSKHMQSLLDTCTDWSIANDMTWAPPKSSIVSRYETPTLKLAGAELAIKRQAKYLGITATVSGTGVGRKELRNRILKTRKAAAGLKELRLMRHLSVRQAKKVVRALITSKWAYMAHLIPITEKQRHRISRIEHQARGFYPTFRHKEALDRVCTAMSAPSVRQTITRATESAEKRLTQKLQDQTDTEQAPLDIALTLVELTTLREVKEGNENIEPEDVRTERRKKWEERPRLKRKIPISKEPLPFLSLERARSQRCCMNWFFGRFPEQLHFRMYKNHHGLAKATEWKSSMYSLMSKEKWSPEESKKIDQNIDDLFAAVNAATHDEEEAAFQEELDETQNYM